MAMTPDGGSDASLHPDERAADREPSGLAMDSSSEPSKPDIAMLERLLWLDADDDVRPYCVIDGSWCVGLYGRLLNSELNWCSLYQGQTAAEQLDRAPFLIELQKGDAIVRWLLESWGQGWGAFCLASTQALRGMYRVTEPRKLDEMRVRGHFIAAPAIGESEAQPDAVLLLRQHFRRFTMIEFEDDGRLVQFRFFDPSVLRIWLESCNSAELSTIFGPIRAFNIESFNELPSLNRPGEVRHYELVDRGGEAVLLGVALDMANRRKRDLALPAPGREGAGRVPGPHLMLRSAQLQAFRRAQMGQFQEEMALDISTGLNGMSPFPLDEAREAVAKHTADGTEIGLKSRGDLKNFTLCRMRHGESFPDNSKAASEALARAESPVERSSLLAKLALVPSIGG